MEYLQVIDYLLRKTVIKIHKVDIMKSSEWQIHVSIEIVL